MDTESDCCRPTTATDEDLPDATKSKLSFSTVSEKSQMKPMAKQASYKEDDYFKNDISYCTD